MLDKVFENGPSKICGKQLLKNLKGYGLLKHHQKDSIKDEFNLVSLSLILNTCSKSI